MRRKYLYIILFPLAAAMILVLLVNGLMARGRTIPGEIPDPPYPISSSIVELEIEEAKNADHPETYDIDSLIELLPVARTQRAVMYLYAEGLSAIQALPLEEQSEGRMRLENAVQVALDNVEEVIVTPPNPGGQVECIVDFDDPEILDDIPDDGLSTFLFDPWWIQSCNNPNGEVHIEPMILDHYHVSFEDAVSSGEDPVLEPRYLGTHLGSEIIRIWVDLPFLNGDHPIPFNMVLFTNLGPEVKLRYRKSDGAWFQWDSLAGNNTNWDISDYAFDIVEVQITRPGTSTSCGPDWEAAFPGDCPIENGPFFMDNFMFN